MKETFGEYIRLLRTESGMTLTQLAAQLDMDSANLSKIENNKREFDEKRLEKLASIFNLDPKALRDELFSEKFANKISRAKFANQLKNVSIQMLIDKTSIELFYNHGETVMTEIFFPNQPMETLKLVTLNNSEMTIEKLEVSEIKLKN